MNKMKCARMREALNEALKVVEEEFEVSLEIGNMRFSDSSFTTKITCTENAEDGSAVSQEAVDLERYKWRIPLSEEQLAMPFEVKGKVFEIVGYQPRSPKYPMVCRDKRTGRTYKMSLSHVQRALAA